PWRRSARARPCWKSGADPVRERRPVEAVIPKRLGRRAACRPALDTEHRDLAAAELAPEGVSERTDGRVILEHEHLLERPEQLGEPLAVDAIEPGPVDHLQPPVEQLRRR